MRTKLIAAAAVMGLVALVLAFEAGPSGAQPPPNCEGVLISEVGAATEVDKNCATIEVTKVVTGTAPPGTTFPVLVVCSVRELSAQVLPPADGPPVNKTLNLAAGETQIILLDFPTECTITETAPPGCTLVSISPPTVDIQTPIAYPVTVTNNCEFSAAPAAIAAPVPAAPTFTG